MGTEDVDKIIRIPGENLIINITPDEEKYRNKYLPDPKKLTDEKLVCTVCSVPLALNVHKGKDLHVHRFLQVLVCEACHNFYGDGCFSADEDGYDKYCRWCGQGGTLYLCSSCNCAFCQKCVKQNLKPAVLADLENDDWKCYICNPRPLFGCRTICWGAEELNKIGKAREQEKLKKQKEKLEKLEEKKREEISRRSRKESTSEDETSTKKRKTRNNSSNSSSPEVMPSKRPKRETRASIETSNLNGSIGKARRRKESSDNESSEEERKSLRRSRSSSKKNKKVVNTSSEDSDIKSKKLLKSKKKKSRDSSDESCEDKRKPRRKSLKKKVYTSDESSDDKQVKKKKNLRKKKEETSDSSSDEKQKKKSQKKKREKKRDYSSDELSEDYKKKTKRIQKKNKPETSEDDSDGFIKNSGKKISDLKKKNEDDAEDSTIEEKTVEIKTKGNLKSNLSTVDNALVKKRIKLAIMWMNNAVKDISELGSLISMRATKFGKKKINLDNLKTYEDVLNAVSKLKQLISGVHSNYDHIEKSLDAHSKPWRILTGLEPENEKLAEETTRNLVDSQAVDSSTVDAQSSNDANKQNNDSNVNVSDIKMKFEMDSKNIKASNSEMILEWSEMSPGEDSDNDEQKATKALISKANETLDKVDKEKENLQSNDCNAITNEISTGENNTSVNKNNDSILNGSKEKIGEDDAEPDDDDDGGSTHSLIDSSEMHSDKDTHKNLPRKSENEKSSKKPTKKAEEELDKESEPEKSSKKKTQQKKACRKKSSEGSGEENENSSEIKSSKEKSESKGTAKQNELKVTGNAASSSEDSSQELTSFSDKIKEKWNSKKAPGVMKLKSSLGMDSEDSDAALKKQNEGEKVLKKRIKPNETHNMDAKKTKLEEKEKEDEKTKKYVGKKKKLDETHCSVEKKKGKIIKDVKDNGKSCSKKSSVKEENHAEDSFEEENEEFNKSEQKKKKLKMSESKEEKLKNRNKEKPKGIVDENSDDVEDEVDEGNQNEYINKANKSVEGNIKKKVDKEQNTNPNRNSIELDGNKKDNLEKNENNEKDNSILEVEGKNERTLDTLQERDDSDIEDAAKEYAEYLESVDNTRNKTEFVGLDSSSTDEKECENGKIKNESNEDDYDIKRNTVSKTKEKLLKKNSERNKRRSKISTMLESSDEDEVADENKKESTLNYSSDEVTKKNTNGEGKDGDQSASPMVITSTESSDSDILSKKKKKQSSSDRDSEVDSEKEKKKKKRKRIKCADSSDASSGSGEDKLNASQKNSQGESPLKGGRKNIKKIKKKGDLEESTIEAAEEEKERRRRIEERQKLFSQVFEVKETAKLEKLVLDFDPKEKKELVTVDKDLVAKMKPHQAKGVKFMWDSCFESISHLKTKKGSGCILAHCMGLGKTFQVISLVHTLLMHEDTKVHTIMVVCPLSTVLNWYNEFDKWLEDVEGGSNIEVFHLTKCKQNVERARELRRWQHNGGVMILGYEMFRNLTCETSKKFKAKLKKDFLETLIDPGSDLIICDEGHMLKNEATALSKAMSRVRTLRRIVLTGTPMQNNLKEYHCMVQFVKPNLLGTRKEFLNRFVNPITNGQFVDSTEADVKVMKRRAHVLHKMLEGLVQRCDYNVLTPFLPPKHEYVISLCLSELQEKLYKHYLENYSQQSDNNKAGSRLFQDWQALGRIWTHPRVLKMSTDKANWLKEKKALEEEGSDEEGSLKDFIVDGSENETTTEESEDDNSSGASVKSDEGKKNKATYRRTTRATRSSGKNVTLLESSDEEKGNDEEIVEETTTEGAWWSELVEPNHLDDINQSAKLVMLFTILKESEMIEDKVLVFSQSLYSLDLIEYFLDKIDQATQENRLDENLGNHQGAWSKGLDYFRLDGSTSSENRNIWCQAFNREDNPRARLFLISTRAGGLGINLTAANRVIIFDASWNPSHDVQSIFRVYRFGQKKPCYVYRFIAHGTMEEKVYDRQVAKQSMSNRVVDEQQVHRHFSSSDLNELYTFTPPTKKEDRPTPALPKDVLMAELLTQLGDWIEKYHEHDSLLENVVEEELNEEERKLAWEDFENDKQRGFMPAQTATGTTTNFTMSQQQIEYMRQSLKAKYPNKTDAELNQILVYQVSLLMRQQQQQQQAAANKFVAGGNIPLQQMYANMTPEQAFNLQQQQMHMQYLNQMQMKQAQQTANLRNILPKQSNIPDFQQRLLMQRQANLARLQMQQMQQKMSQGLLHNTLTQPIQKQSAQTMWGAQTSAATLKAKELERMKQSYQNSRQKGPGVVITELPPDNPSNSST